MRFVVKKTVGFRPGYPYLCRDLDLNQTTIWDLKSEISSLTGIHPRHQKLVLMGAVLEPDTALCSDKWKFGDTIHLAPNGAGALPAFARKHGDGDDSSETSYEESSAGDVRETMEIRIQDLTRSSTLTVTPLSTIWEIKQMLRKKEGHPLNNIDLVFRGVGMIQNNFALTDYGVGAGARLHLVMALPRRGSQRWSEAHKRRAERILGPLRRLPLSLWPRALGKVIDQYPEDKELLFVAIGEILGPILKNRESCTKAP